MDMVHFQMHHVYGDFTYFSFFFGSTASACLRPNPFLRHPEAFPFLLCYVYSAIVH